MPPVPGWPLFGASALIHSVETLKHTVKRLLRDAYAVIPYIDTACLAHIVKRYLKMCIRDSSKS